jgi:hypothetical protein
MSKHRGPTKARPTPRELEGVPGTVEHGFRERPIEEQRVPYELIQRWEQMGLDPSTLRYFTMRPCDILIGREPAGANGELLWHLTISTPSRHPTWDEIKIARYRLLPDDICIGMLLPPSQFYVNVESQDHVFQLWEITDPRQPWTSG